MQVLDNITVLDLTGHIAGPFATKQLADYGADVIKVEPPEGDVCRTFPPFPYDKPDPEKSGILFYLNTNKRSVVLDTATPEGREALVTLACKADLVVEDFAPGVADRLGIGWEFLHRIKPELSMASITAFGPDGPYRDYRLTELPLYAFAGAMYQLGVAEREPVKMAGTVALIECGAAITSALLAVLLGARKNGVGQHVDVALSDIHFASCDRRTPNMLTYQFVGEKSLRTARGAQAAAHGLYPCADGYVDFTAAGVRQGRLRDMLGNAAWLDELEFRADTRRMSPEVAERWNAHFLAWCLKHTMREIWAEARRARVLCAPLFTPQDIFEDEFFRSRLWTKADHPALGEVEFPGRPIVMSEGGWTLRRPAPLLGEHTLEVLRETGTSEQTRPASPRPAPADLKMPLDGIRIADLTLVVAGTYGTMLLGDLGAEVIKIESRLLMQPMTRGMQRRPPEAPETRSTYPNGELGERPWNRWATQIAMYRNKQRVTMDLRRREGLDVLRRLVAISDVVCENYAVDALAKLVITYEWLRGINPNIIYIRMPAYGLSGKYSQARSLGFHVESTAGHTRQRGHENIDVSSNTLIYTGDFMAGITLANATMTALWHRQRTGRGQMVEIPQVDVIASFITQALMEYSLNRRVQPRIGNGDIHGRYPCDLYPALSPGTSETGDDRWIAIHVETDEQCLRFQEAMGNPEWAADPRFAANDGRAEHSNEIDGHIASWTKDRDDYELMHLMQGFGIAAAPVLETSRMFDDPHLRARSFFRKQRLDQSETYEFPGPLFQFHDTPIEFYQDPVTLGEHNEHVYRELLKLSPEEYAALEAAGHIGTMFDESIP